MVGVFGGAFNPIHNGHLLLAEYIREEFKLEKIIFVPAGKPPHKQKEDLEAASIDIILWTGISSNPFLRFRG